VNQKQCKTLPDAGVISAGQMMNKSKPFYTSKTLWGVLVSAASMALMVCADNGLLVLSDATHSAVVAIQFLGLGLAGYGRATAKQAIK
tara:strand:- start:156 stop:419 length:264 start_codon:yes stop_codon:yes gene_type:complete